MPRLNARRYAAAWDQFFPAIAEVTVQTLP